MQPSMHQKPSAGLLAYGDQKNSVTLQTGQRSATTAPGPSGCFTAVT
jgi:hypothetical protein